MTETGSIDPAALEAVRENVKIVRERVRQAAYDAGRDPGDVRLMAVTKTVDAARINASIDEGIDLIGENKVQEFLAKKDLLHLDGVQAHLIGHLQTNKVNKIVGQVDMIQSVDSANLARHIDRRGEQLGVVTPVLVEINIGDEANKTGLDRSLLDELLAEMSEMPHIEVRGLMTIPPVSADRRETRMFFSKMHQLFVDIGGKKRDNIKMDILSMGMSGDYEDAIACGSNLVRVGSAIFGARLYPKSPIERNG